MSAITTNEAPKRTLFAISDDLVAIRDLMLECGGDISNEQTAAAVDGWLKELNTDLEGKVDAYCGLIREMELTAVALQAERDRLDARIKTNENAVKSLKARLKMAMEALQRPKIEATKFTVRIQANGGKVPVDVVDEASIPDEFFEMQPKLVLDKVREALEAGKTVSGAALKSRGSSLRIS